MATERGLKRKVDNIENDRVRESIEKNYTHVVVKEWKIQSVVD